MLMKKSIFAFAIFALVFSSFITSCKKKETCHECHYEDSNNNMVDLGMKCGDELEKLESEGVVVDGQKREVHCHDH